MGCIIMISLIAVMSIGTIVVACYVAGAQNESIRRCLDLKRTQDKLMTGELDVKTLADSQVLRLTHPMFTTVGVGGVGPAYFPSCYTLAIIDKELSRRRAQRSDT